KLYEQGPEYAEGWNFGPNDFDAKPVEWIVQTLCRKWGQQAEYKVDKGIHPHEAQYLKLDCSKAHARLGWSPRWSLEQAIDKIIDWAKAYQAKEDMQAVCLQQIKEYSN
ncbi:MAG: CDP-glucose 4,6-dehydratase, partial [Smithella sp.]